MREVFLQYRPGVVFHSAAYKHVGLMEENPVAAVENNAVATRIVTAAAGLLARSDLRPNPPLLFPARLCSGR